MATYNTLYKMVTDTIRRMTTYPGTETGMKQLSRSQVLDPVFMSPVDADVNSANVIGLIHNILISTFNPRILSGLIVEATDPTSASVTISAGHGAVGVNIYRISKSQTIKIPFDSTTHIFYVNLYGDGAKVERTTSPSQLTLAKIIVPKPGSSYTVKDDEGDDFPWDAYIINLKEIKLHGNNRGKLEEDSLQVLKNSIGDILADNLIGNLRLSEDLKIINSASSLELNSNSMLLKDVDENVVAKFNREGTFFYDTSGIELAKFSVDGAKVGNIVITKNSIESGNFASGALGSGFQIQDNGDAEFNNIFARGKIASTVFEYNTVSAMGGNLLISHDADKLNQDMTASSTALITDGDVTFEVSDILWLKDGTNSEYMTVGTVTSATTYVVTRASGGSAVAWTKGTGIVNLGQSGDGGIFLTASETNGPYMSVFTQAGSPWSALTTKLRVGNLNGFLGYSSDKYGIAIGESTKYLKYDSTNGLRVAGHTLLGSLGISTGGYINSGQTAYDTGTGFWLEYNSGTPRFSIGNATGNKLLWNGTSLAVTGTINATAGNFSGTVTVGAAGKVYIDGANEVIKIYDASSNLMVELGKL